MLPSNGFIGLAHLRSHWAVCVHACLCFTLTECMCGHVCDNLHMLAVAFSDLVSDGVLVGQVLIVEEMLPALGLIEISYLGWRSREKRTEKETKRGGREIHYLFGVTKKRGKKGEKTE